MGRSSLLPQVFKHMTISLTQIASLLLQLELKNQSINKTDQVLVLALAVAAASEATQQGNQENFSTWRLFLSPSPQALALLFW